MTLRYTLSRWSLADLFPSADSAEMQAAFDELDRLVSAFEDNRPRLSLEISTAEFMEMVRLLETCSALAYKINSFAQLSFTADTQDQAAQAFLGRVDEAMAKYQNRVLFFSLWWKDLEDGPVERLMADSGDYRYWLEEMRHFKLHTLSEPEEKIINIKDVTGASALNNLYDSITNRYVFKIEVDGELQELTRGELMVYARHYDPDLRARAYQELYRVYADDGPILGQMYQTLVRDWRNEQIDLRHFHSPMAARNLVNDIPDEVVDTLLDVCQHNAPLFQRYFRLKARWLRMDRIRRYDLYAPVAKSEKRYEYSDAVDMVLGSFNEFDGRIAGLAKRVFDEDHLDSEVRKGKRGGAFCLTAVNNITPWVLVNYQGRPDDVTTLAHELGHAIHAMLAEHHSLFTFHSSLPLAETASMIREIWPGVRLGYPAICAQWVDLPLRDRSQDIIVGDGCFSALENSNEYRALVRTMRRVIGDRGILLMRFYIRPDIQESIAVVVDDLWQGRIGNFNVFKWRLAMALHGSLDQGVRLADIWHAWRAAIPEPERLASRLHWPLQVILTVQAYRGVATRYTFPTLGEVRAMVMDAFSEVECMVPGYEMGERCPTMIFKPLLL